MKHLVKPKPFVKWVGGKRGIIQELLQRVPRQYNRYFEPFVGGGALLFELMPQEAYISDLNQELITAYNVIQENPEGLMEILNKHLEQHSEEYFYTLRSTLELSSREEIAARFIYLNKTCYNGLYRVNRKGKFNSPFGKYAKEKLSLYSQENIMAVSAYLRNTSIAYQSYEHIQPNRGDFVYFDPPYYSMYTQYTDKNFLMEDQQKLADFFETLSEKGVQIMLSNSDTEFIKGLYKNYRIDIIKAPRSVNCKGNKRTGQEVVITNYDA